MSEDVDKSIGIRRRNAERYEPANVIKIGRRTFIVDAGMLRLTHDGGRRPAQAPDRKNEAPE